MTEEVMRGAAPNYQTVGQFGSIFSNFAQRYLLTQGGEDKENFPLQHENQVAAGSTMLSKPNLFMPNDANPVLPVQAGFKPLDNVNPNSVHFRYQLRRPVESWKYVEKSKEDGSLAYLCRACSAVYKHKKSLNKHWKDKHFDTRGPNGEVPEDSGVTGDEEDDEEEGGDEEVEENCREIPFTSAQPPMSNSTPAGKVPPPMKRSQTPSEGTNSQIANRLSLQFPRPRGICHMRNSLRRPLPAPPKVLSNGYKRATVSGSPEEVCFSSPSTLLPHGKRRNSELPQPISRGEAPTLANQSPLDLSLSRQLETEPEEKIKESSIVGSRPLGDRHILTLLLQTAMNALTSEPESIKTIDSLSKNTINLLRVVGEILMSSIDRDTHDPTPSPSPVPFTSSITPITSTEELQKGTNKMLNLSGVTESLLLSTDFSDHMQSMAMDFESSFNTTKLSNSENLHKQVHSNQAPMEAAISCPMCAFVARWVSELRAHMVNHSNHRMFGCCYCLYRAKWKWDVAKHMRRCPLARHVAHLQNECLLRMVCYFPPPKEDILFAYFPQHGFPGVGVDKPISPPPLKSGYEFTATSLRNREHAISGSADDMHSCDPAEGGPKNYTTHQETVVPPPDFTDDDDSNQPLCIDETEVHVVETTAKLQSEQNNAIKINGAETGQVNQTDLQEKGETNKDVHQTTALVFKLKRCTVCNFRTANDAEFQEHVEKAECVHASQNSLHGL